MDKRRILKIKTGLNSSLNFYLFVYSFFKMIYIHFLEQYIFILKNE